MLALELPVSEADFKANVAAGGETAIRRKLRFDSFLFVPIYVVWYIYLNEVLSGPRVLGMVSIALIVLTGILDVFGENAAIAYELDEEHPNIVRVRAWAVLKWLAFFASTVFLTARLGQQEGTAALAFSALGAVSTLLSIRFAGARRGLHIAFFGLILVLVWQFGAMIYEGMHAG